MTKERFNERQAEASKAAARLSEAVAQPVTDIMTTVSLREKDLAALLDTFSRFPSVREVRIFGSRAIGTAGRASDVDLAVFAPDATAREWARLCEALENAPIIYELDVVRAERNTNAGLRERIEREGVQIYP